MDDAPPVKPGDSLRGSAARRSRSRRGRSGGSRGGRAARAIANALGVLAVAVVGVWAIGRMVGERIPAAQAAAWVPTEAAVLAAALPALLGVLLGIAGGRRASVLPRLGASAAIAVALWLVLGEWRAWRWLAPPQPAGPGALRVLYWNASNSGLRTVEDVLAPMNADIMVLANAHHMARFKRTLNQTGSTTFVDAWPFHVVSRLRVRRWGAAQLGLGDLSADDPGRAMFVEFEVAPAGDQPADRLVLWVLDMPSPIGAPRGEMFARASAALAEWSGPAWVYDELGVRQPAPAAGFPTPDVVVGDLNTPRWSRWTAPVTRGMHDAFARSAVGPTGTYPRERPLLPIDAIFVGPGLRPTGARTHDFGTGTHRAVTCEIEWPTPRGDSADER